MAGVKDLGSLSSGIFEQSMGARNRVGMGCRTRLHILMELIPWNGFLGSLKVYKFGLMLAGGDKPAPEQGIRDKPRRTEMCA